jgi:hypothetical protein
MGQNGMRQGNPPFGWKKQGGEDTLKVNIRLGYGMSPSLKIARTSFPPCYIVYVSITRRAFAEQQARQCVLRSSSGDGADKHKRARP